MGGLLLGLKRRTAPTRTPRTAECHAKHSFRHPQRFQSYRCPVVLQGEPPLSATTARGREKTLESPPSDGRKLAAIGRRVHSGGRTHRHSVPIVPPSSRYRDENFYRLLPGRPTTRRPASLCVPD